MCIRDSVRDLPKSQLGIDIENDYEPKYITIRGKGELLASLRKEAKKADKVYLATDPDREGEAISWHLATALKLDEKKMRRITFNAVSYTHLAGPDIVSRGFVYVRESEDLMGQAKSVVEDAIDSCLDRRISDWGKMKGVIKDSLGDFLWKRTKRKPMILPIIMEA